MWTTANRPKYKRDNLRYPSDLTGEEWAHIEALISPGQTWWAQAQGRCARSCEWDHVRVEHGVPMALCAQGPSAQEHALRVVACTWSYRQCPFATGMASRNVCSGGLPKHQRP